VHIYIEDHNILSIVYTVASLFFYKRHLATKDTIPSFIIMQIPKSFTKFQTAVDVKRHASYMNRGSHIDIDIIDGEPSMGNCR
jgi:hypothetical protein